MESTSPVLTLTLVMTRDPNVPELEVQRQATLPTTGRSIVVHLELALPEGRQFSDDSPDPVGTAGEDGDDGEYNNNDDRRQEGSHDENADENETDERLQEDLEASLLAMQRSIEEAVDPELHFLDCEHCMRQCLVVADRGHRRDEFEEEASARDSLPSWGCTPSWDFARQYEPTQAEWERVYELASPYFPVFLPHEQQEFVREQQQQQQHEHELQEQLQTERRQGHQLQHHHSQRFQQAAAGEEEDGGRQDGGGTELAPRIRGCVFLARDGHCKKGNQCEFSHAEEDFPTTIFPHKRKGRRERAKQALARASSLAHGPAA